MSQHSRVSVGVAIAASASLSLLGLGSGTAISAPHAAKAFAATPTLKVVATKKKFNVSGPTSFQPGTVALQLKGNGGTAVVSFKTGYSYNKFRKDVAAFGASEGPKGPSKAGLKHLNTAIDNTNIFGGLEVGKGQTGNGTVSLDTAGTYYVFNDSGDAPAKGPTKLTVSGAKAHRAPVKTTATVKALTPDRWGGDSNLPAKGTITFKNVSKGMHASPHFVDLERVKPGTTRKEIIDFLQNGHGRPPFGLPGPSVDSDILGSGQTMTLSYDVHPGTYGLLCFFPDPMTGIPHAFMGMVKVVTLK
jgi:hypothetical protein